MTNHITILGDTSGHEKLIALLKESVEGTSDTFIHQAPVSALLTDTLWLRHDEHDVTHITDDGDLVLDIRDLFSSHGFWNQDILRFWAMVHSFDLDGWNDTEMYWRAFEWTLFPAIDELDGGPQLLEAFQEMMVGGPVPPLPEFRILVNGRTLMSRLVLTMDGPFDSDEDLDAAVRVRSMGYRPSDKSPLHVREEETTDAN